MYLSISYWRRLQYYLLVVGAGLLMYGLVLQLAWLNVVPTFLPRIKDAIVLRVNSSEQVSAAANLAEELQKQNKQVVVVSELAELEELPLRPMTIIKPWQWAWLKTQTRETVSSAMLETASPKVEKVSTRFGDAVILVRDLQIDSQHLNDLICEEE